MSKTIVAGLLWVLFAFIVALSPASAAQTSTDRPIVSKEFMASDAKQYANDLVKRAESGDIDAQYIIGSQATNETANPALLPLGVAYLKNAANYGHVLAMHNLAVLIRAGKVPKLNNTDALYWYQQAAESGFAGAQNNLGDMYETGDGGTQSYGDAIHWYTRAALQGEPTAYWSLGLCYSKGIGVRRNVVEAYRWLTLAVSNLNEAPLNHASAERELADVVQQMSPAQIADGKRLAERFSPLKQTEYLIGDPRGR